MEGQAKPPAPWQEEPKDMCDPPYEPNCDSMERELEQNAENWASCWIFNLGDAHGSANSWRAW